MQTKSETVIINTLKNFLSEFFQDFTCACSCENKSQEDLVICKSLFETQSALLTQLQSEIIVLKSEITGLRNQFNTQNCRRQSSPRRLSADLQKTSPDTELMTRDNQSAKNTNGQSLPDFGNVNFRRGSSNVAHARNMRPIQEDLESGKSVEPAATSHLETQGNAPAPVTGKRTIRPKKGIVGIGSPDASLSAAPMKISIHVSKVDLKSSLEDVLNYTKSKLQTSTSVTCEELVVRSGSYRGFKVTADANLATKLLEPSFWPAGIVVKKFFTPGRATGNFQQPNAAQGTS